MFTTFKFPDGKAVSVNAQLVKWIVEDSNGDDDDPHCFIVFSKGEQLKVKGDHSAVRNQLIGALGGR